ncbi:MAG: ubiquinol oxidase subunit II [Chlamydiota bacterium]
MKRGFKIAVIVLLFLGVIALTALFLSRHSIAVLDPKGIIAKRERELIITASLLMLIVVIPVLVLTLVFAWRYRETNLKAKFTPDWEHNSIAEYCWWGVPLAIIAVLAVITWRSSHELNPFKPLVSDKKPLPIQVVALQWKWLFIYPEQGIATVNFVQFPAETPINFEITADAPMNSFWIPQLGGQIYAMPAMRTKIHLIANEIGQFRGSSANISGKGFAGMIFTAKASSEADFGRWLEEVKQKSQPLDFDDYNRLAEPSENNPVATYTLPEVDLFDRIVMKYSPPSP